MRAQLIQHVNLLFAGTADCEDIRQEILQNTLDRFDDLVAQEKSPEAAYRLAISGIGDINEILLSAPKSTSLPSYEPIPEVKQPETAEDIKRKKIRAVAVAMYILCAIPLIILSEFGYDILGLCLTLALVATATYLMIITGKKDDDDDDGDNPEISPSRQLKKSIESLIWAIGLAVYLIVSFLTGAWYITWVIFPIMACIEGLANAIIDLKEGNSNER